MARGTWRGMAAGLRFLAPLACAQALIPGHREQTFGTLCFLQDLLPKLADEALPTDVPNNMNMGSVMLQGWLPEPDPLDARDEHTGDHHGETAKNLEH